MTTSLSKFGLFLKRNALAIFLAVVPPLVLWFYFQREHSSLTVTLVSDVSVVSVDRTYAKDIEVKYKSRPISTLRALDMKIENSGTRPITRTDYDSKLTFSFIGSSITTPDIIESHPSSLHPIFHSLDTLTVVLEPMLLNSGDYFVFRVFLVNASASDLPFKVATRLVGVSDVRIISASTRASQEEGVSRTFMLLTFLSILVSILSWFYLLRRYKASVFSFPVKQAASLSASMDSRSTNQKAVEKLAQQLDIRQYDFKSAILSLRLRLESELGNIWRKAGLPPPTSPRSISTMARILQQNKLIPDRVASAIYDLAPTMNREMHAIDSYLTEEEFTALRLLALKTIISLKAAFLRVKQPAQANGA